MRVFSFIYENDDKLKAKLESCITESNILIQIFCGLQDEELANQLIKSINTILPHSEILLTSSAAEISDGNFYEQSITICVSIFQKTSIKTLGFKTTDCKQIAQDINNQLINDKIKLLIIFNSTLKVNATNLLDEITQIAPQLTIAGGNAGDDLSFSKIFIGDKSGTNDMVVVCAALYSSDLQIYTNSIFEWLGIGIDMSVTDSSPGGIIHTINNIPAKEIYRKYLGDIAADNLPSSGFEFPLTFYENDLFIGRAAIAVYDDGSIQYAGDVKKGTKVRFGIGSIINTKSKLVEIANNLGNLNIDGIYIYSCIARYTYFKSSMLDYEIATFNNIAPTSGFFTYGEFFHKCNKNYVLNVTNSFVALSEGIDEPKTNTIREVVGESNRLDFIVNSLSHLVSVANDDYTEMVKIFKQYKELLEESSILIYMNLKGDIINANKLFFNISKYKRSQIIGKKLSYIIKDNADEITNIIWNDIQNGKIWIGILKNRDADSHIFYTKTTIKPIVDSRNRTLMYICSMDDVTEYEVKKKNLEHSIDALMGVSFEKDRTIQEYQILLDRSTAMVRIKQEVFVEVNKAGEEIFGYLNGGLIGKHISSVIDKSRASTDEFIDYIRKTLANKGYINTYLPCIDRNGNKLHLQGYFMAIKISNVKRHDEEIVGILHNVTELFSIQQELENVQKEVIYAMGSISEGRSRETGNHIKRVAEYSYLLAKLYGLDEEQSSLLKLASPMHDIGKLAIPDAILNKPGKLTDEEFEIMKTHAQKGYDMLCFSDKPILRASAQIALTHHEWWNGNGYPNKLKGEEIPIFGRITAVADVFDALSNDRCYKKAWTIPEVVEHMVKNRDIQFQASLVDILVDNLDEFIKIKVEFEDKF
ncbi:hypothetical protein CCY99_05685 [Helicobacter sp. 16-1353]|uniref:HD domain-containing phosphohydrolase n=1 Tax=Helicobacter sp. 16-1353 TaxID=2004996 RepID=UPI000DCBA152|nr:HD domain-containing phosphohydrolase [Helicobacter sp. 16-1353]RAX53872.1 hypothetical protein CCY99_05685 [Helicobacter sp. 16-1353]